MILDRIRSVLGGTPVQVRSATTASLVTARHTSGWARTGSAHGSIPSSSTAFQSTGTPTAPPLRRRLRSVFSDPAARVTSVYKDVRNATWGYVTCASSGPSELHAVTSAMDKALEQATAPDGGDDSSVPPSDGQQQQEGAGGEGEDGAAVAAQQQGEGADEDEPPQKKKKRKFKRRKSSYQKKPDVDPADIKMANVVCPLRDVPYSQQLVAKQGRVVEALQRITEKVRGRAKNVGALDSTAWLAGALADEQQLCCPLLGIVRSPQLDGYRNKLEFTIGNNVEDQPTVGFLLGSFKDGYWQVGEPKDCRHLPAASLQLAAWAQEYIREHSSLPSWDKRSNQGFWRLLTVREGRSSTWLPPPGGDSSIPDPKFGEGLDWRRWLVDTRPAAAAVAEGEEGTQVAEQNTEGGVAGGEAALHVSQVDALHEQQAPTCDEMLVLLQVNDKYTTAEATAAECTGFGRFLLQRAASASPPLPIRALLLQYHSGLSNAAQPDAEVHQLLPEEAGDVIGACSNGDGGGDGDAVAVAVPRGTYIHDSLCELTFRVSSGAFFQVNNGAAALLYQLAGDWAAASDKALLLDVCCGTGTIGLTLARRVREVVGIEMVEQAIEDAKVNARDNDISNCTWMCGKAEDVLKQVLERLPALGGNGEAETKEGDGDESSNMYRTQFDDFSEVVAIVDPPRAGLHPKVLKALLRCKQLRRIVYVSCNPESLAANCIDLCSPPQPSDYDSTTYRQKYGRGAKPGDGRPAPWEPFRPVRSVAVDLFPHTKHAEAVMLLER